MKVRELRVSKARESVTAATKLAFPIASINNGRELKQIESGHVGPSNDVGKGFPRTFAEPYQCRPLPSPHPYNSPRIPMTRTITRAVLLVSIALVSQVVSVAHADVILNAPRVNREPGWAGPALLGPAEKEANQSIPIFERSYRPGHIYGNMVRRHHYRDTVIPSHRDRVEMWSVVRSKQPVTNGKYVKDKYR